MLRNVFVDVCQRFLDNLVVDDEVFQLVTTRIKLDSSDNFAKAIQVDGIIIAMVFIVSKIVLKCYVPSILEVFFRFII